MKNNLKGFIIYLISYLINKVENYLVSLLRVLKSKVVNYSRKQYKGPDFTRFRGFSYFVNNVLLFPWNVLYWIYIAPIVFISTRIWNILYKIFKRKEWFKEVILLWKNLYLFQESVKAKIMGTEIVELLVFCLGASLEVSFLF
jgi:hypothetical protein